MQQQHPLNSSSKKVLRLSVFDVFHFYHYKPLHPLYVQYFYTYRNESKKLSFAVGNMMIEGYNIGPQRKKKYTEDFRFLE
jgi:hypothetical protein